MKLIIVRLWNLKRIPPKVREDPPPSGGIRTPPTHKTFCPKVILSIRNIGLSIEQRLRKEPTNNGPNLRPIL